MLHTINKSPFSSSSLDTALRFIKDGESVLLLEDGVYAAMAGTTYEKIILELAEKSSVFAISADVKARGIEKLIPGVEIADYGKFVDLVSANIVNTWL
ncbi:MAG: sulfurtransferase complex subunit TusB [Leptospirales bacterium]